MCSAKAKLRILHRSNAEVISDILVTFCVRRHFVRNKTSGDRFENLILLPRRCLTLVSDTITRFTYGVDSSPCAVNATKLQ